MTTLHFDGLDVTFPAGWQVHKLDDLPWYRNHFQHLAKGCVDCLAVAPDGAAWFIEFKDYSQHPRTTDEAPEVMLARKCLGALGLLTAIHKECPVSPGSADETAAAAFFGARQVRVALHWLAPAHPSRLFPRAVLARSERDAIRRHLRPLDAHAVLAGDEAAKSAWRAKRASA